MPLTDTAVCNAKRRERPQKLSDGGGLHLLVNPDGARYWRMAYRYHRRQKTLALGVYPLVSLADARAARDAAKKLLARDIDPAEAKKEQKRAAYDAVRDVSDGLPRPRHCPRLSRGCIHPAKRNGISSRLDRTPACP
jgi:Arm DNA-binding domain